MSKRPPNHFSKLSDDRPSTELDPKMLNIAAGGHFYERAKSRRSRHREVFSTGAGRAVTEEAVPLGLRRKNSGDGVREALKRLRASQDGTSNMGEADEAKKTAAAAAPIASESLSSSVATLPMKRPKLGSGTTNNMNESREERTAMIEKISNNRKCDSNDGVIDLTDD
jgi:hypothetical protein